MWPLELVATPMPSPRKRLGGSLRKLGADSKGISGTFWAFALVCASRGAAERSIATQQTLRHRFIDRPPGSRASILQNLAVEGEFVDPVEAAVEQQEVGGWQFAQARVNALLFEFPLDVEVV